MWDVAPQLSERLLPTPESPRLWWEPQIPIQPSKFILKNEYKIDDAGNGPFKWQNYLHFKQKSFVEIHLMPTPFLITTSRRYPLNPELSFQIKDANNCVCFRLIKADFSKGNFDKAWKLEKTLLAPISSKTKLPIQF